MAKRILLFNHKGGVGKTTSAYNIGWKLTQKGFRVLLVDGDSQVNLTARSLGSSFEDYYDEASDTKGNNIYDAVRPIFEGRPAPIEAFECPVAENGNNLFVLPGHPDLSALEGQISLAQETRGTLSVTKNLPGAIHRIISLEEIRHNIDYSVIDINPGLGALNQNFFMISDAFIVPTNPDPFSLMSLKTLGLEIERWVDWKEKFGSAFSDADYPLPEGSTKFLGALHSRFNRHKSKAAGRYHGRLSQIDDRIENELVPKLQLSGCLFSAAAYNAAAAIELPEAARDPDRNRMYALARIPDFAQVSHIASEFEKPVFNLTEEDLREADLRGNVKASVQQNIATFNSIFNAVCDKITTIIEMTQSKARFDNHISEAQICLDNFDQTANTFALRHVWIVCVSALDLFMTELVSEAGLRWIDREPPVLTPSMRLVRIPLESVLELASLSPTERLLFYRNHVYSFVQYTSIYKPERISEALSYIWTCPPKEKWSRVLTRMKLSGRYENRTEQDIRSELSLIGDRRDLIAHSVDTPLGAGASNPVDRDDAARVLLFVADLAAAIDQETEQQLSDATA